MRLMHNIPSHFPPIYTDYTHTYIHTHTHTNKHTSLQTAFLHADAILFQSDVVGSFVSFPQNTRRINDPSRYTHLGIGEQSRLVTLLHRGKGQLGAVARLGGPMSLAWARRDSECGAGLAGKGVGDDGTGKVALGPM